MSAALPANHDDDHAALLGGVPLMLGAGTGAEIRQPLGYAIVGGLIVSQALTVTRQQLSAATGRSAGGRLLLQTGVGQNRRDGEIGHIKAQAPEGMSLLAVEVLQPPRDPLYRRPQAVPVS
jgi:hypothetical protein